MSTMLNASANQGCVRLTVESRTSAWQLTSGSLEASSTMMTRLAEVTATTKMMFASRNQLRSQAHRPTRMRVGDGTRARPHWRGHIQ